ncbi:MAG: hypothetical protein BWY41_00131 [Candidatus Atribacteria bacterium ADurb.Bin276]|uniref:Uncharacterized protein n=1 Tax=Candidatus Atribacter allofermentans TaxID=1852833 RepID=A0A1V5T4W1_9BACT|nr:MAG: hypothetical protein BWY41_00131 [Candidatus Atribacteria bacterium ADurb.Bin276]
MNKEEIKVKEKLKLVHQLEDEIEAITPRSIFKLLKPSKFLGLKEHQNMSYYTQYIDMRFKRFANSLSMIEDAIYDLRHEMNEFYQELKDNEGGAA